MDRVNTIERGNMASSCFTWLEEEKSWSCIIDKYTNAEELEWFILDNDLTADDYSNKKLLQLKESEKMMQEEIQTSKTKKKRKTRSNKFINCDKTQGITTLPPGQHHISETPDQALNHTSSRDTPLCGRGVKVNRNKQNKKNHIKCSMCKEKFCDRRALHVHRGLQHGGAENLQDIPFTEDKAPWVKENGDIDEEIRTQYNANKRFILAPHSFGSVENTYNFPTNDLEGGVEEIIQNLQTLYEQENESFKLNITFGLMLKNITTKEHRYFVPHHNRLVFENETEQISNLKDLERVKEKLRVFDLETYFKTTRTDTKSKLAFVTNIVYYATKSGYPMGKGLIPNYIKNKHCIEALEHPPGNRSHYYKDALCAFRCLALHNGQKHQLHQTVDKYYNMWRNHISDEIPKKAREYRGIEVEDLPAFERCFNVSVYLHDLQPDGVAITTYKPSTRFKSVMHMNIFQHHLSYIYDFSVYAHKFQCYMCHKHFQFNYNFKRHMSSCDSRTKLKFPGGFFNPPASIFKELAEYGYVVPEKDRLYPWYAVYDFEAMLKKIENISTEKSRWNQRHCPVSVSLCSNVNSFEEAVCFIDDDLEQLLSKMFQHLELIQVKAKKLAEEKWGHILSGLKNEMEKHCPESLDNEEDNEIDLQGVAHGNALNEVVEDMDWVQGEESLYEEEEEEMEVVETSDEEEEEEERVKTTTPSNANERSNLVLYYRLKTIKAKLETYISQLPILGFNSSKYDLNLVKSKLFSFLKFNDPYNKGYVIKRDNTYTTISTETFKFLDISHYLAAGSSYSRFLRAYEIEESKGYFPYDYFDSIEKLEEKHLPPHEEFYSQLRDSNITEEEYEYLHRVWQEEGMETFKDFLEWYNNKDVAPFVQAVQKLQQFYFDRGIDVFKNAVSVPGIARQMLFNASSKTNTCFQLFGSEDEDLYRTFKKNIVGGPSIIFHRYHKKDTTYIRKNKEKVCKKILGHDSNALYLYSIGQPLPTGAYIRRLKENNFRPEKQTQHVSMYKWMNWVMKQESIKIIHKLNSNHEKRVGPYLVDGYCSETNTIYEVSLLVILACVYNKVNTSIGLTCRIEY